MARPSNGWRRFPMRSTKRVRPFGVHSLILVLCMVGLATTSHAATKAKEVDTMTQTQPISQTLSVKQQAIVPIAAFAAAGDIAALGGALDNGLHAGLTVSDIKEV